ncbi:MAG: hypothetical protein HUU50_14695 [Candidatus Brocadiae bacterium]|nr:hypothetical protein [Candidatus Brocadiia bacterium]
MEKNELLFLQKALEMKFLNRIEIENILARQQEKKISLWEFLRQESLLSAEKVQKIHISLLNTHSEEQDKTTVCKAIIFDKEEADREAARLSSQLNKKQEQEKTVVCKALTFDKEEADKEFAHLAQKIGLPVQKEQEENIQPYEQGDAHQKRLKMATIQKLILFFLAIASFNFFFSTIARAIGVDFYHFWAVDIVLKKTNKQIDSPYQKNAPHYSKVMAQYAKDSHDASLQSVQIYRRNAEFTASPLLYAIFSFLPSDYSLAFLLFQILEIIFFGIALFILFSLYSQDSPNFFAACTFCLFFLFFKPFSHNLLAGNINCSQFFLLTISFMLLEKKVLEKSCSKLISGAALFMLLALIFFIKINLALIIASILVYFICQKGLKVFFLSSLFASVFAALIFLATSWYFSHGNIWKEWIQFALLGDKETLIRPIQYANYSSPLLLNSYTSLSLSTSTKVVFFSLLGSAVCALFSGYKKISLSIFREIATDLPLLISMSTVFTVALAPLMWSHYYIILLFPALWFILDAKNHKIAILGMLSILLCSGLFDEIANLYGCSHETVAIIWASSWLPLWGGILYRITTYSKKNG